MPLDTEARLKIIKRESLKTTRHKREKNVRHGNYGLIFFLLFILAGAGAAWVYFMQEQVSRVDVSVSNTKTVLGAIVRYRDTRGYYPPAYATNVFGEPTVSWRVLILPFYDEDVKKKYKLDELYKQFDLKEAWDGPKNSKLISKMPKFYGSPMSRHRVAEGKSNFVTIRHEHSVFPGSGRVQEKDVTDLLGETVALFEVHDSQSVAWSCPEDFAYDPDFPARAIPIYTYKDGLVCGMCNGTASFKQEPQTLPHLVRPRKMGVSKAGRAVTLQEEYFSPWVASFAKNSEALYETLREEEEARLKEQERRKANFRRNVGTLASDETLSETEILDSITKTDYFTSDVRREMETAHEQSGGHEAPVREVQTPEVEKPKTKKPTAEGE